jgi:hypothetical protein
LSIRISNSPPSASPKPLVAIQGMTVMKKVKKIKTVIILVILCLAFNLFAQKWVDTLDIKPPPKNGTLPNKPILKDIEEKETKYSYILTLRNYLPGEIEHNSKEAFLQLIKEKIQEIRIEKKIKNVVVVGWADGTINKGINSTKFDIKNECIYLTKGKKIFDPELAKLRGCDIHRRISSYMTNNSIKLSELIDGYDEKDNVNANGEFRKVVITIEY